MSTDQLSIVEELQNDFSLLETFHEKDRISIMNRVLGGTILRSYRLLNRRPIAQEEQRTAMQLYELSGIMAGVISDLCVEQGTELPPSNIVSLRLHTPLLQPDSQATRNLLLSAMQVNQA